MMAALQETLVLEKETSNDASMHKTLDSAKNYFDTWQTYPFCYNDILDVVNELSSEAQTDFLQHVQANSATLTEPDTGSKLKASGHFL